MAKGMASLLTEALWSIRVSSGAGAIDVFDSTKVSMRCVLVNC